MKSVNVVSLFSGAGGFDLGFKNMGFKTIFATDNWSISKEVFQLNKLSDTFHLGDIRELNFKKEIKDSVDVVIGGPPCPAFSKSRFYLTEKKRSLLDSEGRLLYEYIRCLKELSPKVFIFENVHGFAFKIHNDALTVLKDETIKLGYKVQYKVINSANYGVPQLRQRFICIGVKKEFPDFNWPKETHIDPEKIKEADSRLKPWVTAGDVLNDIDIDLPEDIDAQAGSKHKHLLPLIPPGENYLFFTKERNHPKPLFKWRSRYWSFLLKLSPQKPSWTIQASFSNNMGPFHWKNRFLRVKEIARIQTFPDSYTFSGKFLDQWRLIGNAVPPKLSQIFARSIKEQYFK